MTHLIRAVSTAILSLLLSVTALAQVPRTPNFGFWTPDHGQAAWGGLLNANFTTLDTVLSSYITGTFIGVQRITFKTGALIQDDNAHSPGGFFAETQNGSSYIWSYQNSGNGGDYDFVSMASYAPNGQGAAVSVFDGNGATGRNHLGACPTGSGHTLTGGGWTVTSNLNNATQFNNMCGDATGEWIAGPLTITWAPAPTFSQPALEIMPETYSTVVSTNPCNAGAAGTFTSLNSANTGVNGQAISGNGGFTVGAYCNGTNYVVQSGGLGSIGNCAGKGSSASPSVAACGSTSAGSVSCATNASGATCTVNTTAVLSTSEILLSQRTDTATGTAIGVTCNTTKDSNSTSPQITAVVSGTSFTFQLGTISTNPECFSYLIN